MSMAAQSTAVPPNWMDHAHRLGRLLFLQARQRIIRSAG
jgi:hypothetical protein